MRQKPDIAEDTLAACLRTHYGLHVRSVRFLPIGYDLNAFVYRAITAQGESYFVKIRQGEVSLPGLLVPRMLIEHGIPNILAPLRTVTQELWCSLESYSMTVFPFVHGENAMLVGLSDSQWREFGATLKAIHTGGFAALLEGQIPAETFSLPSAQKVRRLSNQLKNARFETSAAARLAAFWTENASRIEHLLARAEALGKQLQYRRFEKVLCHADIHAANILVGTKGSITLVDWDGPLLAPRERDLLFVVGSVIARRVEPREEALFFEGYGEQGDSEMEVDWTALAYYRYERAIEDIGACGQSVFGGNDLSEETKEAEVELLIGLFAPGDIVEAALEADRFTPL